jgi:hypothetical protein
MIVDLRSIQADHSVRRTTRAPLQGHVADAIEEILGQQSVSDALHIAGSRWSQIGRRPRKSVRFGNHDPRVFIIKTKTSFFSRRDLVTRRDSSPYPVGDTV